MRKGFTLIELLAVIVILAILALIVTPIISGVISGAKKSAAERSLEGYVKAVELAQTKYQSKHSGSITKDINELSVEGKSIEKVTKQIVLIDDAGLVNKVTAEVDGYLCVYNASTGARCSEGEVVVETGLLGKGLTLGTAVYINPETKSICNENDAVSTIGTKTGCMKWYVFKDNNNGKYNLILDHNTTAKVAWNTSGDNTDGMNEVNTSLINDISSWDKSLNARLITADEVADIVGASKEDTIKWSSTKPFIVSPTDIDTNVGWFYLDGERNSSKTTYSGTDGWQKLYTSSTTKSKYAWLYDNTSGCIVYGCNINDGGTSGYWTSTQVTGKVSEAWEVYSNAFLNDSAINNSGFYGVRPVITA